MTPGLGWILSTFSSHSYQVIPASGVLPEAFSPCCQGPGYGVDGVEPERDGSILERGRLDAEAMELEVWPDVLDGCDDAGDSGGVSLAFADGAHAGSGALGQLWRQLTGMPGQAVLALRPRAPRHSGDAAGVLGRMESLEDGHRVGAGIEFAEVEVVSRGEVLVLCDGEAGYFEHEGFEHEVLGGGGLEVPAAAPAADLVGVFTYGRWPWPRVMRLKAPESRGQSFG